MKAKIKVSPIKLGGLTKDRDVTAVFLFGSFARGEAFKDIDVCVVLRHTLSNEEMSRKRLAYLRHVPENYDIQIFQQLPLYVQVRVLKEGKLAFCRDRDALFSLAYQAIKEHEYFLSHYQAYLEGVERG